MSLVDAAQDGKIDEVRRLLNQKVNVDTTDSNGETALSVAAGKGHLEIVRLLLNAGANINHKGYMENTPLMEASHYGHLDIVEHLLANKAAIDVGGKDTALTIAAGRGHTGIVRALLNAGANVNHRHMYGATALMTAAEGGHLEVVESLLGAGADMDIESHTGRKALAYAQFGRRGQYEDIIELLTKRPSSNLGIETRLPEESQAEYEANECPMCLQLLYRPVILPCGHGPYCKGCLKSKSDSSCPMCEKRYKKAALKTNKEIEARCDALRKKATPAASKGGRRTRRHRRGTRRSYTRTR